MQQVNRLQPCLSHDQRNLDVPERGACHRLKTSVHWLIMTHEGLTTWGGGAQMTRSHRIALDPTVAQIKYFAQAAGTARFTWNWALAEWNSQYEAGGKPKANELKRFWNSIKYERFPWLRKVHRDAHSQPFANLQAAWTTYFKSLKNGSKAGRPKFKKKGKARDCFLHDNDNSCYSCRYGKIRAEANSGQREILAARPSRNCRSVLGVGRRKTAKRIRTNRLGVWA